MKTEPASGVLNRVRKVLRLNDLPPVVRRLVIGLIGGTLLLIGVAMLVLPGPAVVVIPLALAVLATEFVWAKRWMARVHLWFSSTRERIKSRHKRSSKSP